jgi:serine/threonine-protein kinase
MDDGARFCIECGAAATPARRRRPPQPPVQPPQREPLPIISAPGYRIEAELGSGGGGVAYKAWHERLRKYVVLKRIKDDSAIVRAGRSRGEADILKNLKHAHLPQLYDFLEDAGGIYTVMEFIPGRSFSETLKAGARYSQPNAVRWAEQLSGAIEYLHSQDPPVLHSDIKPGNIMLTPQGDTCLIDFNISLVLTGDGAQAAGLSHGYASPEQYGPPPMLPGQAPGGTYTRRRAARLDTRSDIYSLGATLYHLVSGRRPEAAIEDVTPLRELGLPLSDAFIDIIERCMERDPADRFQTAEELHGAVANIHRHDRRYRAHRIKTAATAVSLALLFAAFSATAALGARRMGSEKVARYNELVLEIEGDRGDGAYESAIELFPEKPGAYARQAVKLCRPGSYEECVEFVEEIMASLSAYPHGIEDLRAIGDMYYSQANAYFELEDYQSALSPYEAAADGAPDNPEIYRDWAIALARCGSVDRAERMLREVEDMDIGDDSIDLLRGEIAYARGRDADAIEFFERAIRATDSEYIKNRAYLICDKAYRRVPGLVRDEIALLRRALDDLPNNYALALKERLADALVRADERNEAAALYEQLRRSGNISYQVWQNIGVLYQQLGQYDDAAEVYAEMADAYPDDYRPFLRLAYLELERQSAAPNEQRDYAGAARYYERAADKYPGSSAGGDAEMLQLEVLISELRQNGWI